MLKACKKHTQLSIVSIYQAASVLWEFHLSEPLCDKVLAARVQSLAGFAVFPDPGHKLLKPKTSQCPHNSEGVYEEVSRSQLGFAYGSK